MIRGQDETRGPIEREGTLPAVLCTLRVSLWEIAAC
jgi:hypothetical protein